MLEKKTTKEQIDIICKNKSYIELLDMLRDIYEDNKVWVSQESLNKLDLYRELCSKLGKAKVWTLNPDELCYQIEKLLKGEKE